MAGQLAVPVACLGGCWSGVGADAGDELGGPRGEGVVADGWCADAVGAEEPRGVLAGVPGDHVPQRLAYQQTVRFGPPVRAPALLVTVGEGEQAGGGEGGLERFDQGRVDGSGPGVPG